LISLFTACGDYRKYRQYLDLVEKRSATNSLALIIFEVQLHEGLAYRFSIKIRQQQRLFEASSPAKAPPLSGRKKLRCHT
jgi:hypothetical protein